MSGSSEKQNRIIVIGGGPGGYTAAIEAAQRGANVMLITAGFYPCHGCS